MQDYLNDHADEISEYSEPGWVTQPLSPSDIASILQGGCASGAYMPAAKYYDAAQTMSHYGDDVLEYIEYVTGEIPAVDMTDHSWTGLACHYLSMAVELFCLEHCDLADLEIDDSITDLAK